MSDLPSRAGRAPDLRRARGSTWALAVATAALGGLLLALTPDVGVAWRASPGWLPVAVLVAFVLSDRLVFHLEARREAVSFTPSEIPLALGVFVLAPLVLLGVRLVAAVVTAVLRNRLAPVKLAINLASFTLETGIVVLLLRLGRGVVVGPGPALWLLAVGALLVALTSSGLVVATAISLQEHDTRERLRREVLHAWLYHLPGAVLGATVALPFLVAPWLLGVVLVPVVLLWWLLRSLGSLRHRHQELARTQAFGGRVGASAEVTEVGRVAVVDVAQHLHATTVALVVLGPEGRAASVHTGRAGLVDTLPDGLDDPRWSGRLRATRPERVTSDGDGAVEAWLRGNGLHDALVVPLGDEASVLGVLVAADRHGVVGRFGPDDIDRLDSLAQQLAMALRKGQLYARLRHASLHDPLTGAANRGLFDAWVAELLQGDPGAGLAVAVLDLDRFRDVNDALGHDAGDRLLVVVHERLSDVAGDAGLVARLGGDEFALALPGADDPTAHALLEDASAQLEEPVDLDGTAVTIGSTIGYAVVPADGTDVGDLLRRADLAMHEAKRMHEQVVRFEPALESTDVLRLGLLGDLRRAIELDELDVHFQPKVSLQTGAVVGVEALARWHHPQRGMIPPDTFISLAEQSGLVWRLTERILARSLAAARDWLDQGLPLVVAVNVSPSSMVLEAFPSTIAAALRTAGVPAELLVLEVTERAMVGDSPRTVAVLDQLERLGIRLSVDDFGTGYSSLASLRAMPVSELKIDRSFVSGLVTAEGSDGIIVASTIQLAHNLGLTVVAEGVETEVTEQLLRAAGCDLAQGYGLCRPLPKHELDAFLRAQAALPA